MPASASVVERWQLRHSWDTCRATSCTTHFDHSDSIDRVPRVAKPAGRALLVALVMSSAVAGCSSGGNTVSESASGSGPPPLATNAQVACERYFEWDLYRSVRLPGAQHATSHAQRAALRDFAQLADRTASSVDGAVIVGDLPSRARLAADRIVRILSRLVKAGGDVSDVSGRVEHDLAGPAARLEAHCAAAGFTLPEDNRAARG